MSEREITVHLFNIQGFFNAHIELVLTFEHQGKPVFYTLNRWEQPESYWTEESPLSSYDGYLIDKYQFTINKNPKYIIEAWKKYHQDTKESAFILKNNCADATQWFLEKFADIPAPNYKNISFNYATCGAFWPSLIPSPVTLPGRVMANAKYYIKKRAQQADKKTTHDSMFQYLCCVAVTPLVLVGALFMFALGLSLAILALALSSALSIAMTIALVPCL